MEGDLKARTIRYILERQCKSGGFCFYRLEEPNGADTFYALATLHLLGTGIDDLPTIRFLKESQAEDGSYHNLYQAYYAIKGLRFMGSRPRQDPRPYLATQIEHFRMENISLETSLKRLDLLTELCKDLEVAIPRPQRREITAFILTHRHGDGGFGNPTSTLLASATAVQSLKRLGMPRETLEVTRFFKTCEHPVHGFLNVPNMAPSFLEHIHAGLVLSRALASPPRYPKVCRRFVVRCQDPNGGFARTSHGLPTLADTYLAIHSLSILDMLEDTVPPKS